MQPVALTPRAAAGVRLRWSSDTAVRIAAGIVILLLWEFGCGCGRRRSSRARAGIVAVFPTVIANPEFWRMAGATLGAVFEGLAIAFVAGTILGVAIGRISFVDRFTFDLHQRILRRADDGDPAAVVACGSASRRHARLATVVFASLLLDCRQRLRRRALGAAGIH